MSSSKEHGDRRILILVCKLSFSQDGPTAPDYDSYPQQLNQQGFIPSPPQDKTSLRGNLQEGDPKGEFPQEMPSLIIIRGPPGYKITCKSINPRDGDGEAGTFETFDFTEKTIRRAFIRKVYGILTCQLLITISFISLFLFHEPTKRWTANNLYMLIIAIVVYFTMALVMICFSEVRRKTPMNLIFLGLFTVATGYMLGVITSTYDVATVMMATCITAAVVLALTLFALQTKYDFTGMGGALLCALVILLLMGIMWPIMPNRITDILYASIGALIFSLYLIYDTQLMLGGNHKCTISPEEYVFAALQLYLDIIILFIRMLHLPKR